LGGKLTKFGEDNQKKSLPGFYCRGSSPIRIISVGETQLNGAKTLLKGSYLGVVKKGTIL
jgi:hypothetical protein